MRPATQTNRPLDKDARSISWTFLLLYTYRLPYQFPVQVGQTYQGTLALESQKKQNATYKIYVRTIVDEKLRSACTELCDILGKAAQSQVSRPRVSLPRSLLRIELTSEAPKWGSRPGLHGQRFRVQTLGICASLGS